MWVGPKQREPCALLQRRLAPAVVDVRDKRHGRDERVALLRFRRAARDEPGLVDAATHDAARLRRAVGFQGRDGRNNVLRPSDSLGALPGHSAAVTQRRGGQSAEDDSRTRASRATLEGLFAGQRCLRALWAYNSGPDMPNLLLLHYRSTGCCTMGVQALL